MVATLAVSVKWGSSMKIKVLLILLILTASGLFSQEKKDALALYRKGKYEESINVCLEELKLLPASSYLERRESYTVLLWSFLGAKRYQEAVNYGLKAYEQSNRDWRIVASLGEAHYYLGNNKEALYFFEKYMELNPSGDKADFLYYLMGHLFIRTEEFNRADVALSMAVFLRPLDAKWWSRLGYAREQARDFQRAKEAYSQALSINPSLVDAERGVERVNKSLGL